MPSFEKYTHIRRKSGLCPTLFDVIEIVLGITLPAELFEDPNFKKIYDAMNDMICISNVSPDMRSSFPLHQYKC